MVSENNQFRMSVYFDNQQEAYFLSLFLKRLTFSDIKGCAASETEAYKMRDAITKLQEDLAANGFAPR